MQIPPDARALSNLGNCKDHKDHKKSTRKELTGALTGAAVVSAGMVVPLATEGVLAIEGTTPAYYPTAQNNLSPRANAQSGRNQAVQPEIAPLGQAAFSATRAGNSTGNNSSGGYRTGFYRVENSLENSSGDSLSSQAALSHAASAQTADNFIAPGPQLIQSADGSWTVAYDPQTVSAARSTQNLVAHLAEETQAIKQQSARPSRRSTVNAAPEAGATSPDQGAEVGQCQGSECRSLAYIERQIPQARQQVQQLQAEMASFETQHAQKNLPAYQQVLASRLSELNKQKLQLTSNLEETRKTIAQLKMRLVTVSADTALAEQVLAQDSAYQTVWQRLQKSESLLAEEFSKADLDTTALDEVYSDYQYHQQWLQRLANEALGNYLMAPNTIAPDFMHRAPAALNVMQALVVATHQQDVQLLRQQTLETIEQKLQDRQSQLAKNLGQYEPLKRKLTTAQVILTQYEQERDRILGQQPSQSAGRATAQSIGAASPAVAQAEALAARLPEGIKGKILLGIVTAAGAAAAGIAYYQSRSSRKSPSHHLSILPAPGTLSRVGTSPLASPSSPSLDWGLNEASPSAPMYGSLSGPLSAEETAEALEFESTETDAISEAIPTDAIAVAAETIGQSDEVTGQPDESAMTAPLSLEPIDELGTELALEPEVELDPDLDPELVFEPEIELEPEAQHEDGSDLSNSEEAVDPDYEFELYSVDNMIEATSQSVLPWEQSALQPTAPAASPAEAPSEAHNFAARVPSDLGEEALSKKDPAADSKSPDDEQSLEEMTRELDDFLRAATSEASTDASMAEEEEAIARELAPITLSTEDVELFAQQAIRWVLQDIDAASQMPDAAAEDASDRELPTASLPETDSFDQASLQASLEIERFFDSAQLALPLDLKDAFEQAVKQTSEEPYEQAEQLAAEQTDKQTAQKTLAPEAAPGSLKEPLNARQEANPPVNFEAGPIEVSAIALEGSAVAAPILSEQPSAKFSYSDRSKRLRDVA